MKKQKGISILFIVLISGVIFTIALGINSISVQQTKIMGEIGHSVVSFYAADSGAEKQLYNLFKTSPESPHPDLYIEVFSNKASFEAIVSCSNISTSCYYGIAPDASCDAIHYCIGSEGKYLEIKRAIEIKY